MVVYIIINLLSSSHSNYVFVYSSLWVVGVYVISETIASGLHHWLLKPSRFSAIPCRTVWSVLCLVWFLVWQLFFTAFKLLCFSLRYFQLCIDCVINILSNYVIIWYFSHLKMGSNSRCRKVVKIVFTNQRWKMSKIISWIILIMYYFQRKNRLCLEKQPDFCFNWGTELLKICTTKEWVPNFLLFRQREPHMAIFSGYHVTS